jgi:hypothetical protein
MRTHVRPARKGHPRRSAADVARVEPDARVLSGDRAPTVRGRRLRFASLQDRLAAAAGTALDTVVAAVEAGDVKGRPAAYVRAG